LRKGTGLLNTDTVRTLRKLQSHVGRNCAADFNDDVSLFKRLESRRHHLHRVFPRRKGSQQIKAGFVGLNRVSRAAINIGEDYFGVWNGGSRRVADESRNRSCVKLSRQDNTKNQREYEAPGGPLSTADSVFDGVRDHREAHSLF